MTREEIENIVDERDTGTIFMDGYDDAIVGYADDYAQFSEHDPVRKCYGH